MPVEVEHTSNPSTWQAEGPLQAQGQAVYTLSSRTARAIYRETLSHKTKTKHKNRGTYKMDI